MKHHLPVLILLLCLGYIAGIAQNNTPETWRPLLDDGLTGARFKILPKSGRPYLLLGLSAGVSVNRYDPGSIFSPAQFDQMVQQLFLEPGSREQLVGQLGGEFLPGTPGAPGTFIDRQVHLEKMYGVQAVVPMGRFFALTAAISNGRSTASAAFPVTVIQQQHDQFQTRQEHGTVQTQINQLHLEATGRAYFFSSHTVQPFAGLGARYSRQTKSGYTAALQDYSWTFGPTPAPAVWAGVGQAGISLQPRHWPVFVELMMAGQLPFGEGRATGAVQATLGWKWKKVKM